METWQKKEPCVEVSEKSLPIKYTRRERKKQWVRDYSYSHNVFRCLKGGSMYAINLLYILDIDIRYEVYYEGVHWMLRGKERDV